MNLGAKFARFFVSFVLLVAGLVLAISTPYASGATLAQGSPTSGTIDVAGSSAFTATLATTSSSGSVSYATTAADAGLAVSSAGVVTTTGTLVAGLVYAVSGTDSDGSGDSGSWNFSLTVTPDTISQGSPTSGTIDVAGSSAFTDSLTSASGFVGPVTYVTSSPSPDLTVNAAGGLVTTGTLVAGPPYTVSGTDMDANNDSGVWSYSLTVTPDAIVQGPPNSGFTTTTDSASFASTLVAASGFVGPVTFATATSGFTVVNGDVLESRNALSVEGSPYTVTGTDADSDGDIGSWTYSLTVGAAGSTSTIMQTSMTTGNVPDNASQIFTAGPIGVENNTGAVTFVTTSPSPDLMVSASGVISTTGMLAVGSYTVAGTDSDAHGDRGTWTYTLSVTGVEVIVTFGANGGAGAMAAQTESGPTELSLDRFTRTGYTFVDWNTSATGSGTEYANGATYSFSAPTTLFAQWKMGKLPFRTVTFNANGGKGTMVSEVDNTPTALSPLTFIRTGYSFVDWNSQANGAGTTYRTGSTYGFKTSVTLFAQWKKIAKPSFAVTFEPNGGTGTMAAEHHSGPAALSPLHFSRPGYTFLDWNTALHGSGTGFAGGALYPFAGSTTLYAQWKQIKKAAPPPLGGASTSIGSFGSGESTLSTGMESEIGALAEKVKSKKGSEISLLGYGDQLASQGETNAPTNVALGRMRAEAVATYLEERLAALGLKGWSISIAAVGAGPYGKVVIATLS